MTLSIVNILFSLATLTSVQSAGVAAISWKHQSVIFATVSDATQNSPTEWTLKLKTLATLSGELDSALMGEISANVLVRPLVSQIPEAPAKGTKIVVVVTYPQVGDVLNFWIPAGSAAFFPTNQHGDNPCLFEVTGFDDPKVTETIENLRKLRGK